MRTTINSYSGSNTVTMLIQTSNNNLARAMIEESFVHHETITILIPIDQGSKKDFPGKFVVVKDEVLFIFDIDTDDLVHRYIEMICDRAHKLIEEKIHFFENQKQIFCVMDRWHKIQKEEAKHEKNPH